MKTIKIAVLFLYFFLFTTYHVFSQTGWQLIYSFPEQVSAICFIDSLTGYAGSGLSAESKKIMKTTDAGDSWNDLLMSDHWFTKIYFYNHNIGFAIGDNGTLYKTTNSGNDWVLIPTGETDIFRGIFFLNEQIGWICAGSDKILRTDDGGNSWDSSFTSGAIANMDVEFINEFTGYVVGVNAYMYKSTDGGINWNQITEPMVASMFDIEFVNEDTGFIVGGTEVAKTVDGGNSWYIVKNAGGGQMNSVETFGNQFVWAAAQNNVYYSSDNGENWLTQTYTPSSYLFQVSGSDSVHLWLLGDRKLYRTSTGGNLITSNDKENTSTPKDFILHQNYPNPFNPTTTINYQIPELSFVTIRVYDVLGNEIAILVNDENAIGNYEVEFYGTGLPSGIYFYKLQAGNFIQTKKMVLMK